MSVWDIYDCSNTIPVSMSRFQDFAEKCRLKPWQAWFHGLCIGEKYFSRVVIWKLLHCIKSVHVRSYSVRMWENVDQNNSKYGHFSLMKLNVGKYVSNTWSKLVSDYMSKINNRNIRARCETCLKSTIKTPERRYR